MNKTKEKIKMRKIKITYYGLQEIIEDECINYHSTDKVAKKGNLIHRVLTTAMGTLEINYEASYDRTKNSDTFSEKITMTEIKDGWQLSLDSENSFQDTDDCEWYEDIFRKTLHAYLFGEHIFIDGIVKSYKPAEDKTSSEAKPSNNTLDDISKRLSVVEKWIFDTEANKFFNTLFNDLLNKTWAKYVKDMAKGTNMGQELFDKLVKSIVDLVQIGCLVPPSVIITTGDYAEHQGLSINNAMFEHIPLN